LPGSYKDFFPHGEAHGPPTLFHRWFTMASRPEQERILIFDFGAQYVQLIARRVRELNVFAQVVRSDLPAERVKELAPKGIILSGGPSSVYEATAPKFDPAVLSLDIPVLGICYGMQLACQILGGDVKPAQSREYGRTQLTVQRTGKLLDGLPKETVVWMS